MAKRNLDWTKEKYERFIKQGRGTGELFDYKPWLTIQDMPSLGRVTRLKGWKTGRVHHLFTDIETRYFYILEFESSVVDIREQYPLLNLEDAFDGKSIINIDKYRSDSNEATYVIATTFLITIQQKNGKPAYLARAVKASSELEKKSILERLEIQRIYWKSKDIDFGIVTEKEIPMAMCSNIEWFHSAYHQIDLGIEESQWCYLVNIFNDMMYVRSSDLVRNITNRFDSDLAVSPGTGLLIFKHLLARKQIKLLDINEKININKPLNALIHLS